MKILFDHQIFSLQKYGGVSKYFCEIISLFPKNSWEISLQFSNNEYIESKKLLKPTHFFYNRWFKGQGRIMLELNKPYSAYELMMKNYDVFHQTHFDTYCLPFIGKKPMVTTFHDINFSTYTKNVRLENLQKKSMDRADKIVAISHNTKRDMIEVLKVPEDKIEVIYHGVSNPIPDSLIGDRIIGEDYVLYVGTRGEVKNFRRFASAFALLVQSPTYKHIRLVCTGDNFTQEEIVFLNNINIFDKIFHKPCTEVEIANLYKNALFFIFPSYYEGFGMPILEAMSYNCPTLIANASCFPEIAGDASIYFDPLNVDDIYSKMAYFLDNQNLRSSLNNKAKIKCNLFTWEKTAEEHWNLYKSLI